MSTTAKTMIDNARALRGMPPADWRDPGLRVVIDYRLSFSGSHSHACSVYRQRKSPTTGNDIKPEHLLTLAGEPPWVLLRQVADLLDPDGPDVAETQGDAE